MSLPRVFDTAIPYVFDMCSAPGDGCKPPVIAIDVSTGVRWRDCTGKWHDRINFGSNLVSATD